MGRPFCRAALGGINDESAIRGFQRTYVGSMPGLFINKLCEVGVNNPIILLDEIDKISKGAATKGDPCAALLEVLDPEQNHSFTDHYINAPVDLSQVTFIATANYMNDIPEPLLDRMEVIQLSGYVDSEKLQISRRYLLPKQLAANALQPDQLEISDAVIHSIIFRYSHESGVRELERLLGAVCRWKAVELTKYKDDIAKAEQGDVANVEPYDPVVRLEDLDTILGHHFRRTATLEDENTVRPGHAIGLAYTVSGNGCVLHIETAAMPGQGNLVSFYVAEHRYATMIC